MASVDDVELVHDLVDNLITHYIVSDLDIKEERRKQKQNGLETCVVMTPVKMLVMNLKFARL